MVSELFKRFVGSAPGYGRNEARIQGTPRPPRQEDADVWHVPIIQKGQITGYTTMKRW